MGPLAAIFLVFLVSLAKCEEQDLQKTYQESLSTALAHFTQSIQNHPQQTTGDG